VYHTGIFLLDEDREFAVLRASNSAGGKKMLDRGHKLQVSQTGIVGFVITSGQPRIALNIGSDTIYSDNPDLPETLSEITLPLRYEERVIGALDVQSTEPNAFNQEDMEALVTLADQVSAAITTTLAIENAKKALTEAQSSFGKAVQEAWKIMRPTSMGMGFELKNSKLTPLEKRLDGDHIQKAVTKGIPTLSENEDMPSSLAIPISLRGRVVGVMNLRASNQRKLTSDEADIARAVTERLSLAIETATLLQSTQHRADIERLTTEISAKISSSTRFETILKTAAEELSKALSGSDVLVQVEPISIELGMEK
jgi:GAF domain-containing protein